MGECLEREKRKLMNLWISREVSIKFVIYALLLPFLTCFLLFTSFFDIPCSSSLSQLPSSSFTVFPFLSHLLIHFPLSILIYLLLFPFCTPFPSSYCLHSSSFLYRLFSLIYKPFTLSFLRVLNLSSPLF